MTQRPSNRRGYALIMVTVFVVLFGAMLGVAWRRVASALRVEHASELRTQCDGGSLQVLADAMRVLETHLCWDAANSRALLDGSPAPEASYWKSLTQNGIQRWYKITFTRTGTFDGTEWSVSVKEDVQGDPLLPSNPP